ncbi:MAG TPA: trehalose-phosphatase [Kofleriaceae bacterium]|nr:trehalose-phosphatase [Kofleriaceae bacterium]
MDRQIFWHRVARHTPLALLLDMDGTLIPLAATPAEARPGPEVRELLARLAATPGVTCAVVSGRPRDALDELLGDVPALRLVAEHGMWRNSGAGWEATAAVEPEILDRLQAMLAPLVEAESGALFERKSASLCVHYRLVTGPGREAFLTGAAALIRQWLSAQPDYEVMDAAEAMEVRERHIHKGSAVAWVRQQAPDLVCVAAGDDVTDEDTFAALGSGDAAILVGDRVRSAAARWRLADPRTVCAFLDALLEARRGGEIPGELLPEPIP